jgi:hypothetical protein
MTANVRAGDNQRGDQTARIPSAIEMLLNPSARTTLMFGIDWSARDEAVTASVSRTPENTRASLSGDQGECE